MKAALYITTAQFSEFCEDTFSRDLIPKGIILTLLCSEPTRVSTLKDTVWMNNKKYLTNIDVLLALKLIKELPDG
jgi:hypothetical protein